ncbi:uncharacterized protein V6R79_000187 [Siganus canaliculatus]
MSALRAADMFAAARCDSMFTRLLGVFSGWTPPKLSVAAAAGQDVMFVFFLGILKSEGDVSYVCDSSEKSSSGQRRGQKRVEASCDVTATARPNPQRPLSPFSGREAGFSSQTWSCSILPLHVCSGSLLLWNTIYLRESEGKFLVSSLQFADGGSDRMIEAEKFLELEQVQLINETAGPPGPRLAAAAAAKPCHADGAADRLSPV